MTSSSCLWHGQHSITLLTKRPGTRYRPKHRTLVHHLSAPAVFAFGQTGSSKTYTIIGPHMAGMQGFDEACADTAAAPAQQGCGSPPAEPDALGAPAPEPGSSGASLQEAQQPAQQAPGASSRCSSRLSGVQSQQLSEHEGLLARCVQHLYASIAQRAASAQCSVSISCTEVYNEQVTDMLGKGKNQQLQVRLRAGAAHGLVHGVHQTLSTNVQWLYHMKAGGRCKQKWTQLWGARVPLHGLQLMLHPAALLPRRACAGAQGSPDRSLLCGRAHAGASADAWQGPARAVRGHVAAAHARPQAQQLQQPQPLPHHTGSELPGRGQPRAGADAGRQRRSAQVRQLLWHKCALQDCSSSGCSLGGILRQGDGECALRLASAAEPCWHSPE